MTKKLLSLVICLLLTLAMCGSVFAAEALYRDIEGNWVAFDHLANPGYDEANAQDVVYYPGTDAPAFNVTYQDVINGSGYGFDDATYGTERRSRVTHALLYIASLMAGETGSADIHFGVSQSDGTGYLAACGSLYWVSNGYQGGFTYDHIKTGTDPLPGSPDANATVDFGYNWYSGTGTPAGFEHDFWSVMLHEFTHALGFSSLIEPNGLSSITGTNPGAYSYFDALLTNGLGSPLTSTAGGASFVGSTADILGQNSGLLFDGYTAAFVYGSAVPIYAPDPYEDGSSLSHWTSPAPVTSVMLPSISAGVMRRSYEDFEIGALSDIGYNMGNVTGVPTTGTLGLAALLGLFGLLMGLKRRK